MTNEGVVILLLPNETSLSLHEAKSSIKKQQMDKLCDLSHSFQDSVHNERLQIRAGIRLSEGFF